MLDWFLLQFRSLFFHRSQEGLLLLTGDSSLDNYLIITLVNGRVAFSFQNLGISRDAMTSGLYNDGMVHTLQFTHFRRDLSFVVDGREQPTPTSGFSGEDRTEIVLVANLVDWRKGL